MDPQPDYRKFAILYVDDEEKSLKNFVRGFGDDFRIFTANSAKDGFKLLEEHKDEIGLLMTDQRMPGENGVWLLEHARQLNPGIVRILATAYSDLEAAIAAVNSGAIYKFINKPWDPAQLEQTLKRGLEFFAVQKERDELLREKLSILHNMMIADRLVSLGLLAAGLSHHIRNSLQAVRTFLDLAPAKMREEKAQVEGLRDPDFWKSYYQLAQSQIERIQSLLAELWTASENPKVQVAGQVNLRDALVESTSKLQDEMKAKGITFENSIPTDLPTITADLPKILRLFELLLKDEIASLPAGCRCVASATKVNDGKRDLIRIEFRDNGPGLPEEALRTLFDPFSLRRDTPSEFGIHLMACFFIVYHHGGVIEARSNDGPGTKLVIHLPIQPDKNPPISNDTDFLHKAVLNESLWKDLIRS